MTVLIWFAATGIELMTQFSDQQVLHLSRYAVQQFLALWMQKNPSLPSFNA